LAYRGQGNLDLARQHLAQAQVAARHKLVAAYEDPAMKEVDEVRAAGARVHQRRGLVALSQGRFDEAVAGLGAAVGGNPDNDTVQVELGRALLDADRLPEAIEQFQAILERWPDQARAHQLLGLALEKQHKLPEAAAQYEAAIAVNAGNKAAHERLGAVL